MGNAKVPPPFKAIILKRKDLEKERIKKYSEDLE